MTFHLMFVHDTFSSVWIAEWPPFVFSHCVFFIFGFEGGVRVLIAPVSVHCLLVTR